MRLSSCQCAPLVARREHVTVRCSQIKVVDVIWIRKRVEMTVPPGGPTCLQVCAFAGTAKISVSVANPKAHVSFACDSPRAPVRPQEVSVGKSSESMLA